VHDLTGYGPSADGDDLNAAAETAALGAAPPPSRTFNPLPLNRHAPTTRSGFDGPRPNDEPG